ncbi:HNH endonuclease [Anaerovorax sp. IOR16]|uniref:HNH endonuclease n=1 Tax=Anaerovorax sp. IOR16 TaxID=2773458 RepID=UPI0019D0A78F|nr:HNH endonuclease signature motif containing protein [Anaerovorax sp. IOR16]
MNKKDRLLVYEKYGGHCAYCGKEIAYEDMQVDHIRPQREYMEALIEGKNLDDLDNLNPSCRRCNHYKRSLDLEGFRDYIKTLHERIAKDYITKVGLDFGIVKLIPFDGVFYFERCEKNE